MKRVASRTRDDVEDALKPSKRTFVTPDPEHQEKHDPLLWISERIQAIRQRATRSCNNGKILEGSALSIRRICAVPKAEIGGREGIRTPDPLLAKQVLSQLSYTPTREAVLILKHFPTFLPLHFMASSLDRARTVHLSPHCTRTVLIGCAATCTIWFILGMKVHSDNKAVPVENAHRVLSDW